MEIFLSSTTSLHAPLYTLTPKITVMVIPSRPIIYPCKDWQR